MNTSPDLSTDDLLAQATCAVLIGDKVVGTAWLVSYAGHLITAAHLLQGKSPCDVLEVKVRFADEDPRAVEIIECKHKHESGIDFAVLRLAASLSGHRPLPISLARGPKGTLKARGYGKTLYYQSGGTGEFLGSHDLENFSDNRLFAFSSRELGEGGYSGAAIFSDKLQAAVALQIRATRAATGPGRDTVLAMPLYRVAQEWEFLIQLEDPYRKLLNVIEEERDEEVESAANIVRAHPLTLDLDRLLSLTRWLPRRSQNRLRDAMRKIVADWRANDVGTTASEDCRYVCDLLEESDWPTRRDREVLRLFCAEVFGRGGCCGEADRLIEYVLSAPEADDHLFAVTYLIQGNLYAQDQRPDREVLKAYDNALERLRKMEERENSDGNYVKAKCIGALRKCVEDWTKQIATGRSKQDRPASCPVSAQCRNFCHTEARQSGSRSPILERESSKASVLMRRRVIPFGLPIVDEVAAGKPELASDDLIGYIHASKLEVEGRRLTVESFRENQVTFLPEYAYFAVQVSGDELEGVGISSSDYLVVQKRKLAELKPDYGDIIATIVDDKGDQPKLKWSVLDSESDSPPGRIAGIAIAVLKPQGIGAEESAQSPSLRSLRLTPVRLLPVLDEPALTRERPASSRVIFFVQSNRLAVDDQPLSVTPLKDSQITFLPEYDYLTVHISGDSMDQAGISPNDYVILMKSKLVNVMPVSGDIVAVVFRDEDDNKATLKRIRIHHDSVEFRPESSNPAHHSRIVPRAALAGDNPSVEIVGIAIAVLKPQA